jgi:2-polyprenyl-3-methyl-5-hydroxy-6-metoxy-1,4-benzoquinol methylase
MIDGSHDADHPGREHGSHDRDFDELARTWDDDPAKVERARVVAGLIDRRLDLGPSTSVFEYGAGTGLVAQHLAPLVGPITMSDPSAGMRAVMEEKAAAGTLPAGTRIWSTDLDVDPVPDERFDLVVAVQVLHHVADLARVLDGLAAMTAPGGHLAVCDLEREDGSFHGEGFGGHRGFDRAELGDRFREAGFADVSFEHAYDLRKHDRDYPLFLAIAVR